MKLTEWFPADVKPVRVGLYQRALLGDPDYSYWNGKFWGPCWSDKRWAFKYRKDETLFPNLKWRGIAK